jgi:hypothetical protein
MAIESAWYAGQLRAELALRSRRHARGRAHVESYGSPPVIVFAPENGRHGNFFPPAYAAIVDNPRWMRRFDKVLARAARSLPRPPADSARRWRELDSSMSSDALLMNVFCTPGVAGSAHLLSALGVEPGAPPEFGWKARVPLGNGRFDRTEVDMRFGSLLVEAKLTESDFQICAASVVEAYRDFDEVFARELLPRVEIPLSRPRTTREFPEDYSQEFESEIGDPDSPPPAESLVPGLTAPGYASYQLIRSVLAAYAAGCSFSVLHDARRPDLREQWFRVLAAIRRAEIRVQMKVLTWQELVHHLPRALQQFLDQKYGIVAPGKTASPATGLTGDLPA